MTTIAWIIVGIHIGVGVSLLLLRSMNRNTGPKF